MGIDHGCYREVYRQERDQEMGLDYFGARYYGSALGRWTSPDQPMIDQESEDPQSWNLYSYVRNNPLRNTDPFGLDCITTSNQSSSGVTVTTERGGSAETCSGTYVNGTVDTSSYQYNGTSLTYSFANDTASGAGTINFASPQVSSDSDDISPFGAAVIRSLGARTDASYKLMGVFAAGSLAGGATVANGLALSGSALAEGLISQTSQYLSKAAARALAQRLATTPAQAAAAASAISRATASSSVKVFQEGTRVVVQIVRLGQDGYQEIESVIDQAGNKDVVQKAINNAGDLVHYDPK